MNPGRLSTLVSGITVVLGLLCLECKNHYNAQACRIEDEILIAKTKSVPLDTAVTSDGKGGSMIAWAEAGSTYVVHLKKGEPRAAGPRRIETPIDTGLVKAGLNDFEGDKTFRPNSFRPPVQSQDLDFIPLSSGRSLLVFLKIPEAGGFGGGAFATLISNDDLSMQTVALGAVSEYAQKISALALGEGRVLIVWDGGKNSLKLQAALIRTTPLVVEATTELDASGEGPALVMGEHGPFVAWSEAFNVDDQSIFRVQIAKLSKELKLGGRQTVANGKFIFASPDLVSTPSGLGLVYRDKEDKYDLAGLYFVPLSKDGDPAGEKQRISRADGKKGPALKFFNGLFVSAAVRSDERNLLIGINRFDYKAVKKGGEFQVYADITDYVCVDIAAVEKSIVTVFGEDTGEGGRIIAGRVICAD